MHDNAPYSVRDLTGVKLSFSARRKLRRAHRKGRTGLILQGIIRTGVRSFAWQQPAVGINEGSKQLCVLGPQIIGPTWVALSPGKHRLRFIATRPAGASVFERDVNLRSGQVLVAVCEPIQPWSPFGRSPKENLWYIGISDRPAIR
ncbi:MAG TPA: hypothetical protein VGM75_33140 [Pseudonocardiaceae bacterium]